MYLTMMDEDQFLNHYTAIAETLPGEKVEEFMSCTVYEDGLMDAIFNLNKCKCKLKGSTNDFLASAALNI